MKYFKLLAFVGIAAATFAGCTVKSSDDTKCNTGDKRDCNCDDGKPGEQTCNKAGTAYGACSCDGTSGTGGSGSGTGGGSSTGTGGDYGTGGGAPLMDGGPGPDGAMPVDGAVGPIADAAPADGSVVPDAGPSFTDACLACAEQVCPTELDACSLNSDCLGVDPADLDNLGCMLACLSDFRANSTNGTLVKPSEAGECGTTVCGQGGGWGSPQAVDADTTALINCLAADDNFPAASAWGAPSNTNCTAECFGAKPH